MLPFHRIVRLTSRDFQSVTNALAAVAHSMKLLLEAPPNSFLGKRRYDPFPLPVETELLAQTLPDKQMGYDLEQPSVQQHVEAPICPDCHINMKWYRSTQVDENPVTILHLFACPACQKARERSDFGDRGELV